jgi:hypothetical protein
MEQLVQESNVPAFLRALPDWKRQKQESMKYDQKMRRFDIHSLATGEFTELDRRPSTLQVDVKVNLESSPQTKYFIQRINNLH